MSMPDRLALAKELGVAHLIDASSTDVGRIRA